ncbi:DUF4254 domain-containing protein [Nocardia sp. CA-120079]|uniref:DUF4254 domain-containing protein n=1 Tax=Nocardia sp. CA-120079 TaxID=3239974 RepID=UPI003D977620
MAVRAEVRRDASEGTEANRESHGLHRGCRGDPAARASVLIEPLPTKGEVLRACRGVEHAAHPLLRAANELACLHERRLADGCRTADIDSRRAKLVREINHWAHGHLPPAHGSASVHTETLGAVLDRLARYTATAYAALASATDYDLGDAWEALAELAIGYEDLVHELAAGRRRLPGGP